LEVVVTDGFSDVEVKEKRFDLGILVHGAAFCASRLTSEYPFRSQNLARGSTSGSVAEDACGAYDRLALWAALRV